MAPIYIAIALICGYIFASRSPKTRYRYKRSNGWDAYFYVASWGGVFLVAGWFVTSGMSYFGLLRWIANTLGFVKQDIEKLVPVEKALINYEVLKTFAWIAVSTAIAGACGMLSRYRFNDPITRANWLSQNVRHSPEESLLVYAASTRFPLVVTLSSRKVYIGVLTMPALENGSVEYIELLPIMSGFRDKDELTLHLTTNYHDHYSKRGLLSGIPMGPNTLSINSFRVVIPAKEIESMSLFDKDTYNDFKAQEEQAKIDKSNALTTQADNVLI
ncbi:hypothetical protein SJR62_14430 [Aeromonas caviae]|uniref:SMODS-associating 2TM beta-strand rich effector domain-containing protein n=1 Tax=Aeromonas caviae TaxID=648 RepID=A0AAW9EZL3_AERCA|nr:MULTISPECIES: hypothetical protein [Aeromonas]MDX7720470.1 hypothetical protein [Aeromonas caviae]MDX7771002.1 hypothetical protein [Aeromonas caviae]